jgi:acyl-CoA dehydrogenase
MSCPSIRTTRKPRLTRPSTSPSLASTDSAWRTGIVLTASWAARSRTWSLVPAGSTPSMIASRRRAATSSPRFSLSFKQAPRRSGVEPSRPKDLIPGSATWKGNDKHEITNLESRLMRFEETDELGEVRREVRRLCADFPNSYWEALEPDTYPTEFIDVLNSHGWLSVLIPEEYGGGGASLSVAVAVVEEINASGCNAAAGHAQLYTMGVLLRHGSELQRKQYLPGIADGSLRLQAFAVTEPGAGSDTTRITTIARSVAGGYLVSGQKVFISRAEHSHLMILLARTTPIEEVVNRADGLSVFIVDLRAAGDAITIRPISTMMNHSTCEVFFDDLWLPDEALIGEAGRGFRYVIDGWNAERILIASECIGDGRWFVEQASRYASEREVFGRPIGVNQGVQFPIARAHAAIEAASLVRWRAAWKSENDQPCGGDANMAKLLASEASWEAANAALNTFGGLGFCAEAGIERKFRETRLYQTAPVSNNLVLAYLASHELGMPRSY